MRMKSERQRITLARALNDSSRRRASFGELLLLTRGGFHGPRSRRGSEEKDVTYCVKAGRARRVCASGSASRP